MGRIPMMIPITDLRQDAAAAIKKAQDAGEPIVITQRGRATAVLLGIEAYEKSERERQLLLQLARGDREIEEGRGHGLDAVLADADRLLSDPES